MDREGGAGKPVQTSTGSRTQDRDRVQAGVGTRTKDRGGGKVEVQDQGQEWGKVEVQDQGQVRAGDRAGMVAMVSKGCSPGPWQVRNWGAGR